MAGLDDMSDAGETASADEALRLLNYVLNEEPQQDVVDVVVEHSESAIRLPRNVAVSLREVLVNAVAGKPVEVIPMHAELTTQQAAYLLNVSRPHVVKLMDEGDLPGHKVGTHRRIYASDVKKYKRDRDIDGRMAADKLTSLTEGMGLYE